MKSHLGSKRKTLIFLLFIILLLSGCAPKKTKKKVIPPPEPLQFEVKEENLILSDGTIVAAKAGVDSRFPEEGKKLVSLVTEYVNNAFLKPQKLSIKNNILLAPFAEELHKEVKDRWDDLSIGGAAPLIKQLFKNEGEISKLWIYSNENLIPLLAALDFNLKAAYRLKDGQQAYLGTQASLVFEFLNGAGWKIISYQLRQKLESQSKPSSNQKQLIKIVRVRESSGWAGKRPITILLLGSDSRTEDIGGRSDAIMLIKINPQNKKAILVSFPRDSRVNVPGYGATKINNAMAYGGPKLAVRTIEDYTGIPIDYFAVSTFKGFVRMMDSVGGLDITISEPIYDRFAGAFLPAGTQKLNGGQVLAYSRARHIPGGDLTRAAHQQHIVIALFEQLRTQNTSFDILKLIPIISNNIATNLSIREMFLLAKSVLTVNRENIEAVVLPGYTQTVGGASYVILNSSKASEIFEKVKTL